MRSTRSVVEAKRRSARLEAARYGETVSKHLDVEELLFRVGRSEPKMSNVCKLLLGQHLYDRLPSAFAIGHQSFDEFQEPPMQADYAAVSPGAGVDTVLWTPNTTTQPHTAVPANGVTRVGQRMSIQGGGTMTVPATPGTSIITPRWGTAVAGTSFGGSATITAGTAQTAPWCLQWFMTFRGPMASATATAVGAGTLETNGFPRDATFGSTTATVDMTTAQGVVFSVQHSVASYSWTPKILVVFFAG